MAFTSSTLALESDKKSKVSKLALGFISMTALVLVSTAGAVSATNGSSAQNGNGYGGITNNIDVNVEVNGNNNIVQIIFNFVFG